MGIYAVSDLHGCYNLYKQICNFIKPKDTIIFLGDAGDRGPESWKTIKAIYNNPQWIYLKGNHEDMLIKAMRAMLGENYDCSWEDQWNDPISLCYSNGGRQTLNDWIEDGRDEIWIQRLSYLKTTYTYLNINNQEIVCTHAGFTDNGKNLPLTEDLLWDRYHIYNKPELIKTNRIIIHGHTPIPHLYKELKKYNLIDLDTPTFPLWYCNNKKVDIDCGSFLTNKTILLDLDTFKVITFEEEC